MAKTQIDEEIRPISDLKGKAGEIVNHVTQSGRPVVLTRHGRGVAVVLSVGEYEHLQAAANQLRLIEALREGERAIADGRVASQRDVLAQWSDAEE
jgi:prevent-host-death family protein